VLFEPVAPGTSEALWAQLGEDGSVHDTTTDAALAAPPREFGAPEELYETIEAERVEELNEKLETRVAEATGEAGDGGSETTESADDDAADVSDLDPVVDDRIGFEEFKHLDLRVGEIVAAEGIDGADDLVRLTVDIGVEERQIVAGLKQLHDVEALPGTRVVVVANLEAAELFGVESNGMVLAAGEEADLLTTHEDAPLGTRVR